MRSFSNALIVRALLAAAVLFLGACSTPVSEERTPVGQVVPHSFGFDIRDADPKIGVLDFKYGESNTTGTTMDRYLLAKGAPIGTTGVYGRMKVGRYLYVKWKVLPTARVYEKTVDLTSLLPSDMNEKSITFDIKEDQLYVYVVYPDRRPPQVPANGPSLYRRYLVKTIYPDHDRAIQ